MKQRGYNFHFQYGMYFRLDAMTDRCEVRTARIGAHGYTLAEAAVKAVKQLRTNHIHGKRGLFDVLVLEGEDEVDLEGVDWDMLCQYFTNYIPDERIDVIYC